MAFVITRFHCTTKEWKCPLSGGGLKYIPSCWQLDPCTPSVRSVGPFTTLCYNARLDDGGFGSWNPFCVYVCDVACCFSLSLHFTHRHTFQLGIIKSRFTTSTLSFKPGKNLNFIPICRTIKGRKKLLFLYYTIIFVQGKSWNVWKRWLYKGTLQPSYNKITWVRPKIRYKRHSLYPRRISIEMELFPALKFTISGN